MLLIRCIFLDAGYDECFIIVNFEILKTAAADERFSDLQFFSMFRTATPKLHKHVKSIPAGAVEQLISNILALLNFVKCAWHI